MKRRQFLSLATATLSTLSLAASPARAEGSKSVEFTPEAYEKALASGEPLLLDFSAPW